LSTQIEEIALSEFDLSLSEVRIMNMSRILQVEKSMRLHGQLQPVIARVHDGGYQLIDGFKRYYASETLLMETLQCRLLDIELSQAKVLLLSYNRPHQSMEAYEEALVLQDLQESHSLDQRSLAELTGYSRSWVSRRLSLIDKMDESVGSQIMMGVLTSSHARALIKLPRGNQAKVARAISNFGLTSRQSEALADAFLKAKDADQQHYILTHPEQALQKGPQNPEDPFDARLSSYGNDVMQSACYAIRAVQILLSRLDDHRFGMFNESERVIITPILGKVCGYAEKLKEVITHLQTHKQIVQDER
jgi:ParB family chromosome partitioning protein